MGSKVLGGLSAASEILGKRPRPRHSADAAELEVSALQALALSTQASE